MQSQEDVYSFSQPPHSKRVYLYKRFDEESYVVTGKIENVQINIIWHYHSLIFEQVHEIGFEFQHKRQ